jgi:hypothetical protein
MVEEVTPNLSDFSLVRTTLEKIKEEENLRDLVSAFYFYVLDLVLALQTDEMRDAITDTCFLNLHGKESGHDRGIDAVYIDDSDSKPVIHLFNFKYALEFEGTKSFFPASEIDKILGFLNSLMQKENTLLGDINPLLAERVQEIWDIFDSEIPSFVFHICSNRYHSFEENEKKRFEREIHKHSNFEIKYHLMRDLVNLLTKKGKKEVNARIQAIDKIYLKNQMEM